jgi:hypothetical protein
MRVVVPALKSSKAFLLMEPGLIASEKVALTLVMRLIPLASLAGLTLTTVGGVVSVVTPRVNRLVKNPVLPEESSLTKSCQVPLGLVRSKSEKLVE